MTPIADLKKTLKFVAGKHIADFAFSGGEFLNLATRYCTSVLGIELQQNCVDSLTSQCLCCVQSLDAIKDRSLDVVVSLHVIEH